MSANQDEYAIRGPMGFGAAIREFRRRHQLTQEQLATQADIHRSYLAKLESGAPTQAMRQIMRALAVLDLEIVVRERSEP